MRIIRLKNMQIKFAVAAFLGLFLIYSFFWVYSAYNLKKQVASMIAEIDDKEKFISVKKGEVSISGYPFSLKVKLSNAIAEVDFSNAGSYLSLFLEKSNEQLSKLKYQLKFDFSKQNILINKALFTNEYKVFFPKKIYASSVYSGNKNFDFSFNFRARPYLSFGLKSNKKEDLAGNYFKKLGDALNCFRNFNVNLPSFNIDFVDSPQTILKSKGVFIDLEGNDDKFSWNLKYNSKGVTYYPAIERLLKNFSTTFYLSSLAKASPIQYEQLINAEQYLASGFNRLFFDANFSFKCPEGGADSIDVNLVKFEQSDYYSKLSGSGDYKLKYDSKKDSISLDGSGYVAAKFSKYWYQKWQNQLRNVISRVGNLSKVNSIHGQLLNFLPKPHLYKYIALGYQFLYQGSLKEKSNELTVNKARMQTDEFVISLSKKIISKKKLKPGGTTSFAIKINNYDKILDIGLDYLETLLNIGRDNSKSSSFILNEKSKKNISNFIEGVNNKKHICPKTWSSEITHSKGLWYINNYRATTVKSVLLSLIS